MVGTEAIVFGLILLIGLVISYIIGRKLGRHERDAYWEDEIINHRKDAVMKSRAVLSGQFSEQLAPYLPNFDFKPTECKFLGRPIDFIVFKGLDEKKVDEIVFVEVKSGNSKLSNGEKSVKDAIDKKMVRWEEYRVPDGLTKKDNFEMEEWKG